MADSVCLEYGVNNDDDDNGYAMMLLVMIVMEVIMMTLLLLLLTMMMKTTTSKKKKKNNAEIDLHTLTFHSLAPSQTYTNVDLSFRVLKIKVDISLNTSVESLPLSSH